MAFGHNRVAVTLPIYNAGRTLASVVAGLPSFVDDVIGVDDASTDDSASVAAELGVLAIRHPSNRGYGAAQKSGYTAALARGADVVVLLHPDGQHDPAELPDLLAQVVDGGCDFVIGSRFAGPVRPTRSGMSVYRYVGNRALTTLGNAVLGTRLSELHSGYRAYRRSFLEGVPFTRNSDWYDFDEQLILQAVHGGYRIGETPVRTSYPAERSSITSLGGVRYGTKTVLDLGLFILHRAGVGTMPILAAGARDPRPASAGTGRSPGDRERPS